MDKYLAESKADKTAVRLVVRTDFQMVALLVVRKAVKSDELLAGSSELQSVGNLAQQNLLLIL